MRKSIFLLICFLVLVGCQRNDPKKIVIAEQFGLAYAPLQVMKEQGFLEAELSKDYTVEWVKLGNTMAIREAMLSGDLDVGFIGIPPFLIGVDQQMPWKIMTGLSQSPLALITDDEQIKTLEDLVDAGKIALPQPGSIQHILLSMAAENEMGQADLFDHQLISMNHPDGLQALQADTEVIAYFASPPYLFQGLEESKNHVIITGEEAMGEAFTFIVGVCQHGFYNDRESYEAFLRALMKSYQWMNDSPDAAVLLLAELYELEPSVMEDYLFRGGMIYSNEVLGVQYFNQFMVEAGYIDEIYQEDELKWK